MSGQPLEVRMAHLEGGYEQLDKPLGRPRVEHRLAVRASRLAVRPDRRAFAQVDSRFGQVELRLDGLGRRLGRFSVADDVAHRGHVDHDDACRSLKH